MSEVHAERSLSPGLPGGLTPEQEAVVRARVHALEVAAGPGTGKTHTLVHVVHNLVKSEGIRPERIAVLTFTRDATATLERRLNALIGKGNLVQVASFHSFCARLLDSGSRRFLDRAEARAIADRLARELLASPQGKKLQRALGGGGGDDEGEDLPSRLLGFVSYCKNREVGVGQAIAEQFPNLSGLDDLMIRAHDGYEDAKGDRMDFDDLLLAVRDRLRSEPRFLDEVAARLDVLLVDEYQDVNRAQHDIVQLLTRPVAGKHRPRVVVVGDGRQAIYGFRGGHPRHLHDFGRAYPEGARARLALTLNFRSHDGILDSANRLFPDADALAAPEGTPTGPKPQVTPCADTEAEARVVADRIVALLLAGEDPAEIAVLVRSRFLREAFDKEVWARDADAAFLAANRSDALEAAESILAFAAFADPGFDLSPSTQWVLGRLLHGLVGDASKVADFVEEAIAFKEKQAAGKKPSPPGPKEAREKFQLLRDRRAALAGAFKGGAYPTDLVLEAYEAMPWRYSPGARAARILLRRVALARRAGTLAAATQEDLKAQVLAAMAPDHAETLLNTVRKSTIHAAKGLEWDHVFLLGAREGGIPSDAALSAPEAYRDDLVAEEKRLFYVALTRPRKGLVVTWPAKEGRRSYEPSRFLEALAK